MYESYVMYLFICIAQHPTPPPPQTLHPLMNHRKGKKHAPPIHSKNEVENAIVIVAKCPLPGTSKTRLAPLFASGSSPGPTQSCAMVARALLSDVLCTLHGCAELVGVTKFVFYAPGTDEGRNLMEGLFRSLGIPYRHGDQACIGDHCCKIAGSRNDSHGHPWTLLPMAVSTCSSSAGVGNGSDDVESQRQRLVNLRSSDLGDKLADILVRTREQLGARSRGSSGAIAILGMDSPEIPLNELSYALELSSASAVDIYEPNQAPKNKKMPMAYLSPSLDGGYGMLCLPPNAPPSVFGGIRWSHPLTALSQIKALTDAQVGVELGSLMRDIDEPDDLRCLAGRLRQIRLTARHTTSEAANIPGDCEHVENNDVLTRVPPMIQITEPNRPFDTNATLCDWTWKALLELGIVK